MNTNAITQLFFHDITLPVNQRPTPDMIRPIVVVLWAFLFLKSRTNSDISFHSRTHRPDNYNSVWGGIIEDPFKRPHSFEYLKTSAPRKWTQTPKNRLTDPPKQLNISIICKNPPKCCKDFSNLFNNNKKKKNSGQKSVLQRTFWTDTAQNVVNLTNYERLTECSQC